MVKKDISKAFSKAGRTITKYTPEILTGIGIAGFVTTAVLAAKATPKAVQLIEKKKKEENKKELTKVEVVSTTVKEYLPAIVTGILSTTCVLGAHSINHRRTAALAAAYNVSQTALSHYKEAIVETIGEKKAQFVENKACEKMAKSNPINEKDIVNTGKGIVRFYDPYSGRRFYSDTESIRRSELEFNKKLLRDDYLSLNDFYFELGLEPTLIGNDIGWNNFNSKQETMNTDIDICFEAIVDDDEQPTLVMNFRNQPRYRFNDIWAR